MDPFQGLAAFVLGKMKESAMALWMKLLFQMGFSALASYLFICGSVEVSTGNVVVAHGSGQIAAAFALIVLFRRTPLTKGMMAVLPAQEATKEIETDFQVVQK